MVMMTSLLHHYSRTPGVTDSVGIVTLVIILQLRLAVFLDSLTLLIGFEGHIWNVE